MIQEMNLKDALEKYLQGREVLSMWNDFSDGDKPSWQVEPLEESLSGLRFLVDVPATVNPDFEEDKANGKGKV